MNARNFIWASGAALAAGVMSLQPAGAAISLLLAAGGGGGAGQVPFTGLAAGQATTSGATPNGFCGQTTCGGAGGVGGLGGGGGTGTDNYAVLGVAGENGGGGAGWLGSGGAGTGAFSGAGGLSFPTFAGGDPDGAGFGGGGEGGLTAGGGGGGYSGGGGGDGRQDGSAEGGGGGSYAAPEFRTVVAASGVNGTPVGSPIGPFAPPDNGYVMIDFTMFAYTGSVVEYTVPQTGLYFIGAVGAQGGDSPFFDTTGGYGAEIGGVIYLDAGTELDILVGGSGEDYNSSGSPGYSGDGGGGSFVWDPTAIPAQPAIPEPSTWAMLLLGFAGVGWIGRRRARRAGAAA
jgi:hypothetical protein